MGYRPATSSEKPAPTTVASVQESAAPDATDTSVFLVDGVLSYIAADGNVASLDLAGGGEAGISAAECKHFGVDAGFDLAPGVTGTEVYAYKRAGRVWLIGSVQVNHVTGADVLAGGHILTVPADWAVPSDYPGAADWGAQHEISIRPAAGGQTETEAVYAEGGDPGAVTFDGWRISNTAADWNMFIGGFSWPYAAP